MTADDPTGQHGRSDPAANTGGPRSISIRRRASSTVSTSESKTSPSVLSAGPAPTATLLVGMKSPTKPQRRPLPLASQAGLRRWWPGHGPHSGARPAALRRVTWRKLFEDAWRARGLLRVPFATETPLAGGATASNGAAALAARIRQTYGRARGTCIVCTTGEMGPWAAQVVEQTARCLAADGMGNVLAIDAQLEQGFLSERFRMRSARGLSDALLGWSRLSEVIHPAGIPGLHLLPAGTSGPAGRQVLARMQGETELGPWLARLRQRFDLLLFAAPQTRAAETLGLAHCADVSLLVVPLGDAERRTSRRAVEALRAQGCAVAGVAVFPMTAD